MKASSQHSQLANVVRTSALGILVVLAALSAAASLVLFDEYRELNARLDSLDRGMDVLETRAAESLPDEAIAQALAEVSLDIQGVSSRLDD